MRIGPPQTGHSAGLPATRSSQASRTTSASVNPVGSNSLIAERSVIGCRMSSGASLVATGPNSNLSEDSDHLAEHRHVGAADRLHSLVLGLQPDVVLFAEVALHGRFFAEQGDDDLAVAGALGALDDHEVPLDDP